MNKIVCESCGLVNLEKFVTFPHCAACGAHLPQPSQQELAFWRRPVRAPMWASIIGLGCAALGVLAFTAIPRTTNIEDKNLVVYAALPRQMSVGRNSSLRVTLDGIESDSNVSSAPFESVRLRFSGETMRDFILASVSPTPTSRSSLGSGHYFQWDELKRDQTIHLVLRPRRAGEQSRLDLTFFARGFMAFPLRRTVAVTRSVPPAVPNSGKEKKYVQRRR